MAVRHSLQARLVPMLIPAGSLLVAGYFGWHAVGSDTGLVAWGGYRAERQQLEAEAERVRAARAALAHRVKLLDPKAVDPDYADELVREQLGLVREDEVVVPLTRGD